MAAGAAVVIRFLTCNVEIGVFMLLFKCKDCFIYLFKETICSSKTWHHISVMLLCWQLLPPRVFSQSASTAVSQETHLDWDLCLPVVDIPAGGDVPALDSGHHLVHDHVPQWLFHGPRIWPIEHDVGQHPARIIGYLDPIRLAVQQVTVTREQSQ